MKQEPEILAVHNNPKSEEQCPGFADLSNTQLNVQIAHIDFLQMFHATLVSDELIAKRTQLQTELDERHIEPEDTSRIQELAKKNERLWGFDRTTKSLGKAAIEK